MRGRNVTLLVLLAVLTTAAHSNAPPGKDQAVEAAREFGRALTESEVSRLEPYLPQKGKVRLHLECLGPERGSYSAGQVLALIDDFLKVGTVHNFELSPPDVRDDGGYVLIRGRARVIDREGRTSLTEVHLTFVPEDGHWILREIRETRP